MIISTSLKKQLWRGVAALLLLAVMLTGIPHSSTWANPPDGTPLPQAQPVDIKPFSFQLKEPPGGAAAVGLASIQPAAGGEWSTLMRADFEGAFPPTGWQVQGETVWVQSSTQSHEGTHSAGVENFAGAPSTWLVYGGESGFSLDDQADARLDFAYWLDTEANTYFGWAASADGINFYGARTSGRVGSWLSGALDLKHLVGDSSVWLAFAISGDGGGDSQNVFLDDVTIGVKEPYRIYLPAGMKNYVAPFPDFHDDFGDPGSGWPRFHVNKLPTYEEHRDYSDEYGSTYKMKLGGYTWFHRIFASPAEVHARDEFTLQTDIMYDYGDYRAGWGLILEASDDMEYYYMAAMYRYGGGTGVFFHIRRRTPSEGEVNLAADPVPSYLSRSKGEWSTLRVVREGNSIAFYALNPWTGQWELLSSVDNAPPLDGNRVGFTVFNSELGADAWFDNFHLWQRPLHP
jgi:hypothetical protein